MTETLTSGIKKDLEIRQNRPITTAQDNNIENAKRYTSKDLDDFVRSVKDKSFVLNSINPAGVLWNYEQHKLCLLLSGGKDNKNNKMKYVGCFSELLPEDTVNFPIKENHPSDVVRAVKSNKSTIVQLALLDKKREKDAQKVKIKYPVGLLDEFIQGYQKIVSWLEENGFDALLLDGSNPIQISQHEFENAIRFLEKMKLVSMEMP